MRITKNEIISVVIYIQKINLKKSGIDFKTDDE